MAKQAEAEVVEEEAGLRSRMFLHEALVEYINETYGVDLDTLSAAEVVAWAFAKRNEFRGNKDETQRAAYEALLEANKPEPKPVKEKTEAAEKPAKATKATKTAAAKKATPVKKATKKAAAASADEDPFA